MPAAESAACVVFDSLIAGAKSGRQPIYPVPTNFPTFRGGLDQADLTFLLVQLVCSPVDAALPPEARRWGMRGLKLERPPSDSPPNAPADAFVPHFVAGLTCGVLDAALGASPQPTAVVRSFGRRRALLQAAPPSQQAGGAACGGDSSAGAWQECRKNLGRANTAAADEVEEGLTVAVEAAAAERKAALRSLRAEPGSAAAGGSGRYLLLAAGERSCGRIWDARRVVSIAAVGGSRLPGTNSTHALLLQRPAQHRRTSSSTPGRSQRPCCWHPCRCPRGWCWPPLGRLSSQRRQAGCTACRTQFRRGRR